MATDTVVKRTSRTRKTAVSPLNAETTKILPTDQNLFSIVDCLSSLMLKVGQVKEEIEKFQKEIMETKANWEKEKNEREKQVSERNREVELLRKRDEEEYQYQWKMERKRIEDEFGERKAKWEKELLERKEEIETEKRELADLREKVAGFESEMVKAVKEAQTNLAKEMDAEYTTERKLREQEIKSEKEILNLKINSLVNDNMRLTAEVESLKKGLDEATKQVKEIAVKVIEARAVKQTNTSEE